MNKIIHLTILAITINLSVKAQYFNQTLQFLKANSIWVFGNKCGLDFSNGGPLPITTALNNNNEGCASIADSIGNLLFYMGNNGTIYNRNHQPMLNGTGIYPRQTFGSSSQGALIVPVIDTPWKYYAFTNMAYESYIAGASSPYLTYSVIDMTLDNGLGGVEAGRKNIALDTVDSNSVSECLIAIPGDNCDIWLLTYSAPSPAPVDPLFRNCFKAWRISAGGIDPNPVISDQPFVGGLIGNLAVSPDRQKIALSFVLYDPAWLLLPSGTILCRFDPSTGRVFDSIFLERRSTIAGSPLQLGVASACFSPDNSKLYINVFQAFAGAYIEQLDISTYNQSAIQSSVSRIGTGTHYSLKLYNDTIYAMSWPSGTRPGSHLSRIVNPNALGPACGFEHNAIGLIAPQSNVTSLTNQVVFPIQKDITYQVLNTTICKKQSTILRIPDNFAHCEWDNGDTSGIRVIDKPGIYWVKYTNSRYRDFHCGGYIDTFLVELIDLAPIINVNVFDLSTTMPYSTYQWLLNGNPIPGATNRLYTVKDNGDYTVVVTDENGCVDTADIYPVTNWTTVQDTYVNGNYIRVYPNPSYYVLQIDSPEDIDVSLCGIDGRIIQKVSDAKIISISNLPEGIYLLRIVDKEGRLIKVEKIFKQRS